MPSGVYQHKYGYKHTDTSRRKISLSKLGVLFTRKEKISYRGIHYWVRKYLGIPLKCKFCDKERTTPKSIHWANKSHKYLRELTDWISLCASCHKKYDYGYRRSSTKLY